MANYQDVFEYGNEPGLKTKVGYFNTDKAQNIDEPRNIGNIGLCSGGEEVYHRMWLTASNKWVLQIWTVLGREENSSWRYVGMDVVDNWFYKAKLPKIEEKEHESEDDESPSDLEPPKRKRGRPKKEVAESNNEERLVPDKLPTSEDELANKE